MEVDGRAKGWGWYPPAIMLKVSFVATVVLCVLFSLRVARAQSATAPAEAAMVKAVDAESPAAVGLLERLVDIIEHQGWVIFHNHW